MQNVIRPEGLILPEGNGGLQKKPDFKVAVVVCTHRDVKVQVFNLLRQLENCPNPKIQVVPAVGDALIDRSRSIAASRMLQTDNDYLWFIDDDIVTNSLDITKMMWQMKKDDLDIHGAAYPIKSETDKKFAVRTISNNDGFPVGKDAPIQEMRYLSTGCMGIHRRVFEKMIEKEVIHLCHPETQKFYPFFTPMEYELYGKWVYLSEDWAFCQRAIDLGFKVWCDFSVKLGHIGPKVYTWDDFFHEKAKPMEGFNYNINIQKE